MYLGSFGGGPTPHISHAAAFAADTATLRRWFQRNTGPRVPITDEYVGDYGVASAADARGLRGKRVRGRVTLSSANIPEDFEVVYDPAFSAGGVHLLNFAAAATNGGARFFRADGMNGIRSTGVGGVGYVQGLTIENGDISRCGFDGIRAHKNSSYRRNFVHDLRRWDVAADGVYNPNADQSIYPHMDCCQVIRTGNVVEECWLESNTGNSATSVFMVKHDVDGEPIASFIARRNFIGGKSGYLTHIVSTPANGDPTGVVFEDNLIAREVGGLATNPWSVGSLASPSSYTLTGNLWEDTRAAVPNP